MQSLVTPATAQKWLDTDAKNRDLNEHKVAEYTLAMSAEVWQTNRPKIGGPPV